MFLCAYDTQNGQNKYIHKRKSQHILTDIITHCEPASHSLHEASVGRFCFVFCKVLDSTLLSIKACPLGGSIALVLFEKPLTAAELLHGCSLGDKAGS